MANVDVYSGSDILEIDDRLITDFGDGDVAVLSFPNQKISKFSGDSGNTITVENAGGNQAQLVLRILQNSSDYRYLMLRMSQQDADLVSMVKLTARLTKVSGDSRGNVTKSVIICDGGNFQNGVNYTKGKNGNVEVAVALFTIIFSRGSYV
jgi:hypothetical protein